MLLLALLVGQLFEHLIGFRNHEIDLLGQWKHALDVIHKPVVLPALLLALELDGRIYPYLGQEIAPHGVTALHYGFGITVYLILEFIAEGFGSTQSRHVIHILLRPHAGGRQEQRSYENYPFHTIYVQKYKDLR